MQKHGVVPVTIPSNAKEVLPDGIGMTEAVELLSRQKAEAVYNSIKDNPEYKDAVVLGADTIVYLDEIMGKPVDRADAYRMLSSIRGTHHYVATGVTLIYVENGRIETLHDITKVFCTNYSDEDIYEYIDTDEPYDKAGSYAIQGAFGKYIDHIEGDYENVMGLPFYRIEKLI